MGLLDILDKKERSLESNETFIRLVRLGQGDPETRKTLVAILSLDEMNRRSAINTFVRDMALRGAPQEFIEAIASLLDDEVAVRALGMLTGEAMR